MPATPATHRASVLSLTRREGLTALAVLGPVGLLAACSGGSDLEPVTPTTLPATVATAAAAQEQELVVLYDAVIGALPDLAPSLRPIREQHVRHASTLDASSRPSPTPIDVPETLDRALVSLVAAERRAMRQRIDSCVEADVADLARTLAFIAASEASHVPALRALRP